MLVVVFMAGYQRLWGEVREQQLEIESSSAKLARLNIELKRRVEARSRELERAEADLETFRYTTSHDMRAPLRHASPG